jgi:hypothetical protein
VMDEQVLAQLAYMANELMMGCADEVNHGMRRPTMIDSFKFYLSERLDAAHVEQVVAYAKEVGYV